MDEAQKEEVQLTDSQYEKIMDRAATKFKDYVMKYGDKTALCKCYVSALLEYTHQNKLEIHNGKVYKKS